MDTVDSLKICTFNANNLGNYQNQKDVFDYLRQQKASIYFLQETAELSVTLNSQVPKVP